MRYHLAIDVPETRVAIYSDDDLSDELLDIEVIGDLEAPTWLAAKEAFGFELTLEQRKLREAEE